MHKQAHIHTHMHLLPSTHSFSMGLVEIHPAISWESWRSLGDKDKCISESLSSRKVNPYVM